MGILKLQTGERVPFTVASVVRDVPPNNPKFKAQHKFVGHTPFDEDACLFMAPDTAVRQLTRLGLSLDTVVGQTIEFAKPGEYVDINKPSGTAGLAMTGNPAITKQVTPKQPFSAGPAIPGMDPLPPSDDDAKVQTWKRLTGLHKRCLAFVLENEVLPLATAQVGASPESVSALTAQLFIACTQAGLHR